ncbi:hypothetical protein BH20BAC1_BH20BAC1_03110 [soil metagenome]
MPLQFKNAVKEYSEAPLTSQVVMEILEEYKRPYDKIHELIKSGDLQQIKKGLYIPGPNSGISQPEALLVANHLWGPSYVSMETALSHWGLIPESVYEISSLTVKSAKKYNTPLGRFTYFRTPVPYYSFGITKVELTKRQVALMATPEKALCDKIIMTSGIFLRSVKQTIAFLQDDLRIDKEQLLSLNKDAIQSWISQAPKKSSLEMLIKSLQQL